MSSDPLAGLTSLAPPPPRRGRQPIHVLYGGAHLYRTDTPKKLGALALAALARFAGDAETFGAVFPVADPADLLARVREKLEREPVEDYRIDFEDGFGVRGDAEEDEVAERAAIALAAGCPTPFVGIRVKALTPRTGRRAARTLDLFLDTLLARAPLPPGFVVTLPKVEDPVQVRVLGELLAAVERRHGLPEGGIPIELMIETPRALLGADGACPLPSLLAAGDGRVRGAHLGAYDLTAALGVAAVAQTLDHPINTLARSLMLLAGSSVFLSDGATTTLPIPRHPHAPTPAQEAENRAVVHAAWRLHAVNIRSALRTGLMQGWDLHPAQLVARHATTLDFFRADLPGQVARLQNFFARAAQASRVGEVFDDAATGRALVAGLLRAWSCGAVSTDELSAAGLPPDRLALDFDTLIA